MAFSWVRSWKKSPNINNIVSLQEELQENWRIYWGGSCLRQQRLSPDGREQHPQQELGAKWEYRGIIPKDQGSERSKQQNGSRALGTIRFLQHKLQARMLIKRTKLNYKGLTKIKPLTQASWGFKMFIYLKNSFFSTKATLHNRTHNWIQKPLAVPWKNF